MHVTCRTQTKMLLSQLQRSLRQTSKKMVMQSKLTHPQQGSSEEQVEATAPDNQSQACADNAPQPADLRRSERTRTLTEKGQALLDDKFKQSKCEFQQDVRKMEVSHQGLETIH